MFRSPLGRLRVVGFCEGTTLLLLLAVGVPLKHLAAKPEYDTLLGPLHGAVFVTYLLTLWGTVSEGGWSRQEILWTAVVSLMPFGTFVNDALLRKKQRESVRARLRWSP